MRRLTTDRLVLEPVTVENAAALLLSGLVVFQAFVGNAVDGREARQCDENASYAAENAVDDAVTGVCGELGEGHRQIARGHSPELRQAQIEQFGDCVAGAVRHP